MKQFKDLGITTEYNHFTGEKIKVKKILNRAIAVHGFKIDKSKFDGECLHMQIEIDNAKHVVFTGSKSLMDTIKKVPKQSFPFTTTIVENNERFEFT